MDVEQVMSFSEKVARHIDYLTDGKQPTELTLLDVELAKLSIATENEDNSDEYVFGIMKNVLKFCEKQKSQLEKKKSSTRC